MAAFLPRARLRKDALAIFQAALDAADPVKALRSMVKVTSSNIRVGGKTFALGAGHHERVMIAAFGVSAVSVSELWGLVWAPTWTPKSTKKG